MPGSCQQMLHLWTQMQHEHYTAAEHAWNEQHDDLL